MLDFNGLQFVLHTPDKCLELICFIHGWLDAIVIDRNTSKRIIKIAWKEMQMKMGCCISMDLIIDLESASYFFERLRSDLNLLHKSQKDLLVQIK